MLLAVRVTHHPKGALHAHSAVYPYNYFIDPIRQHMAKGKSGAAFGHRTRHGGTWKGLLLLFLYHYLSSQLIHFYAVSILSSQRSQHVQITPDSKRFEYYQRKGSPYWIRQQDWCWERAFLDGSVKKDLADVAERYKDTLKLGLGANVKELISTSGPERIVSFQWQWCILIQGDTDIL